MPRWTDEVAPILRTTRDHVERLADRTHEAGEAGTRRKLETIYQYVAGMAEQLEDSAKSAKKGADDAGPRGEWYGHLNRCRRFHLRGKIPHVLP